MDKSFIGIGLAALGPITLAGVLFCVLSLSTYGWPMASYDVVLTHYKADTGMYSPLLPTINTVARTVAGEALYPVWWILLSVVVCFYIPYIFLWEATHQHRYGVFFIYGSAIPIINFILGMLPQAILVCLIILLVARPKWFWGIVVVAGLTHTFGPVIIIMAKIWLWYHGRFAQSSV